MRISPWQFRFEHNFDSARILKVPDFAFFRWLITHILSLQTQSEWLWSTWTATAWAQRITRNGRSSDDFPMNSCKFLDDFLMTFYWFNDNFLMIFCLFLDDSDGFLMVGHRTPLAADRDVSLQRNHLEKCNFHFSS